MTDCISIDNKLKHESLPSSGIATVLAEFAVNSLLEEARLSPKPGLVDAFNNGSHEDMNLQLLEHSAKSLKSTFYDIAQCGITYNIGASLRERIAHIGRIGELKMYEVTHGVNTHKGAIWSLGLITAVTSCIIYQNLKFSIENCLKLVGVLASYKDAKYKKPSIQSHGDVVRLKYDVKNALQMAQDGFPILVDYAFPTFERMKDKSTQWQLVNTLLALIAHLDDTCILYRSNMAVLKSIQFGSQQILANGGVDEYHNKNAFDKLTHLFEIEKVSPGGSADMLAALIYLNKINKHFNKNIYGIVFI